MKYRIEVRNPNSLEWVVIETGAKKLAQIKKEVAQIKKVYPEYLVRAFNLFNSRMLAFA
jgi:isocitrate lyase